MIIARLIVDIQLPGCRSLKDKRSRLRKLRDKFGSYPNIAVTESARHDALQSAQWVFVLVGAEKGLVEREKERILAFVQEFVDGYLTDVQWDFLH